MLNKIRTLLTASIFCFLVLVLGVFAVVLVRSLLVLVVGVVGDDGGRVGVVDGPIGRRDR